MKYLFLLIIFSFIICPQTSAEQYSNLVPYSASSPWNTPIPSNPDYDYKSTDYIKRMAKSGHLGSNISSWTLPVYIVGEFTPVQEVKLSGLYSEVTELGQKLNKKWQATVYIPIPEEAEPALGDDAQMILWNPTTGEEWGFWQMSHTQDSGWIAVNGYQYNSNWSGVPPKGFGSRGAGVPYLTGLIRPWEIIQGHIDHALALAVTPPAKDYIYPATKSDGRGGFPNLPMGARLQLDPHLTEQDFSSWGLDRTGKIIARAMQKYGMYIIDGSGHPKIYAEFEGTANWSGLLGSKTVTPIPYKHFRVLEIN